MNKISLTICVILSTMMQSLAYDYKFGDLYYNKISDVELELTRETTEQLCDQNFSGDIVIPATISSRGITYTVTQIGPCALNRSKDITSITIPSSVARIGEAAFAACPNLKKVVFEDGDQPILLYNSSYSKYINIFSNSEFFKSLYLGREIELEENSHLSGATFAPFKNNTNLTDAKFANHLSYIPSFDGCTALSNVALPPNIIIINGFSNCPIKSLYLPSSVKHIENYAFSSCPLESINLPDGLERIGTCAFFGTCIKSISIPETCSDFSDAFSGSWVEKVVINSKIERLQEYAFQNCHALEEIVFPQGITEIGFNAFAYCEKLKSIKLPETLESVQSEAFIGCSALEEILIDENIWFLGDKCFAGCDNLKTIKALPYKHIYAVNNCFSESAYQNATLYYNMYSIEYGTIGSIWMNFVHRQEIDPDIVGVHEFKIDNLPKEVVSIYNSQGYPCSIATQGIIIIRYSDGSTEKRINN